MADRNKASSKDKQLVLETLKAITARNQIAASAIFSLFASETPFIPPTDENYFVNAALHTPRYWLGSREPHPNGTLNWIESMENVFVTVSIPRDKSEVNIKLIARDLPSTANNYAFRRFVNFEADDSQAFNSGIIGSPNVLGSVKLHWNSSIKPSIEFVLQEVYASSILASLKFPHPLLYLTLDSNYGDQASHKQISITTFERMVGSFGLSINPEDFQKKGYEAVKFMVGLACIVAILSYTPLDETKLPSLQFNSDVLVRAGMPSIPFLTQGGQAQRQVPVLQMIDLLRAEYNLFRSDGMEAMQIRNIYSEVHKMKDKESERRSDDHDPAKRSKRPDGNGGGAGGSAPGKVKVPLLPTDEDIIFGEELYKKQTEIMRKNPDPTPDAFATKPELIKEFSRTSLTEDDIRHIVESLQVTSKKEHTQYSQQAQQILKHLEPPGLPVVT